MAVGLFHLASSPISPLLFFGPFCLLIGYLILSSSFLPRVLGVLMALAGLGWLAFLSPAVPRYLSLAIEVLGFLAELSLCLWLLVMGVNVERWKQQASATGDGDRCARWTLDSVIRKRKKEYEHSSNDETDSRSVAAFQGQDGRCP